METSGAILIVDDDPFARMVLQQLLAGEGYALIQAATGAEALSIAFQQQPDLILLDVMIPAVDGYEVCRQLRQTAPLREVPILMITSLSDKAARVRGLEAGADSFISKPFDPTELRAQVRTIMRLNRYRKLLAEQARFERLIQLSPDGVAIIAADSRLLLVNPALVTLLGEHGADALLGRSLTDILQADSLDRYLAGLEAVRDGAPQQVRLELAVASRDGAAIPVEVSIGRFRDMADAYAQLIVRDISERKRAEALIHRQLSRLTSLHAIGVAITASLDLDVTLTILLERVLEQLGVDAAGVLLFNRRTGALELAASRGLSPALAAIGTASADDGLAGKVFQTRQAVSVSAFVPGALVSERDRTVAAEYASYRALPLQARGEVRGVLEIYHRAAVDPEHDWWVFLEALAVQAAIAIDTAALFGQLQHANAELSHAYNATIEGWSRALDLRDHETEGHSARVTELSLLLARRMKLAPEQFDSIRRGALLHDIGKMGVPDRILLKPGPLSPEEWDIMRRHPVYAYEWLSPIPFLQSALAIPYAHHERWDGTGYPRGLRGEDIPLAARIFAVVDIWDALRSSRPYRPPWPEDQIRAYIRSLAGTHLDPRVVELFLDTVSDLGFAISGATYRRSLRERE